MTVTVTVRERERGLTVPVVPASPFLQARTVCLVLLQSLSNIVSRLMELCRRVVLVERTNYIVVPVTGSERSRDGL